MGEQDNLLPECRLQISALIASAYLFNSSAPNPAAADGFTSYGANNSAPPLTGLDETFCAAGQNLRLQSALERGL
jgi:hypothetical protein